MLNDTLARLTIDQLKSLMRWLPDTSPTGKKDILIGQILKSLDDDGLRTLWDRLDDDLLPRHPARCLLPRIE